MTEEQMRNCESCVHHILRQWWKNAVYCHTCLTIGNKNDSGVGCVVKLSNYAEVEKR
jgi:hypothetical protein